VNSDKHHGLAREVYQQLQGRAITLAVMLSAVVLGACTAGNSEPERSSGPAPKTAVAPAEPTPVAVRPLLPDVVVADTDFTDLPTSLAEEFARRQEFAAVSPLRGAAAIVDGQKVPFAAIDPDTLGDLVDLELADGSLGDLKSGGVMLHESTAGELGLGVGDT
jgi:hypothetical protein